MKAIGVKALKAKLSEYLRLVKAGETVLVTERDEVIAELRPCRRQDLPSRSLENIMDQLADQGVLTRQSENAGGWPTPAPLSQALAMTSAEILEELRREKP